MPWHCGAQRDGSPFCRPQSCAQPSCSQGQRPPKGEKKPHPKSGGWNQPQPGGGLAYEPKQKLPEPQFVQCGSQVRGCPISSVLLSCRPLPGGRIPTAVPEAPPTPVASLSPGEAYLPFAELPELRGAVLTGRSEDPSASRALQGQACQALPPSSDSRALPLPPPGPRRFLQKDDKKA